MYKVVESRFREALAAHIREIYQIDVPVVSERPPKLAMGEVASPLCFELAKRLKKPPRALAQEIANSLKPIPGVARVEVAGGGYLNAFFDRAEFFRGAVAESEREARGRAALADAPKDDGRAHQHQSQQGRAHRPSAQRRPGRHVRARAALRRPPRRGAELHRQHRRAGRRRGARLHPPRAKIARRSARSSPPRRSSITSAGTSTRA